MIHVGIAIAILMGSLLLGVSIPFAFGAGTIYMYTMLGGTFATTLPVGFNGINTMVLLAIPTFIMAGGFIEKGKVGDELVSVVEMLVGRFRGGLMLAVSYASAHLRRHLRFCRCHLQLYRLHYGSQAEDGRLQQRTLRSPDFFLCLAC